MKCSFSGSTTWETGRPETHCVNKQKQPDLGSLAVRILLLNSQQETLHLSVPHRLCTNPGKTDSGSVAVRTRHLFA